MKFARQKSFSLVEILVVIGIFLIIVVAVFEVYISSIKIQRYNLASYQLLDQVGYAAEYISRFARMAVKDKTGFCLDEPNKNYETTGKKEKLTFVNYKHQCQQFYIYNDQLYQKLEDENGEAVSLLHRIPLTSPKFIVKTFKIIISGDEASDNLQPRVTILLEVQAKNISPAPVLKIQTTLSQRNLDR